MLELLERLETLYQPEREAHRIKFRVDRRLAHASFCTNFGGHFYLLTVRGTLPTDLAVEAAGLCVARIVLGHEFKRAGYKQEYLVKDLWEDAMRWLSRRLIPDSMMSRMQRKGWDQWDLAELLGTTDHLTEYRIADWRMRRGQLVTFPRYQEALERAIEAQELQWCVE